MPDDTAEGSKEHERGHGGRDSGFTVAMYPTRFRVTRDRERQKQQKESLEMSSAFSNQT